MLQNDPGVRVARGFGNFQESYFIRGFILNSDDVAYNGLYSLLPRQYIATELFERVEVLRGASAFLNGANPGGGGIGGAINLLPKRAPNEALTRVTAGLGSGDQWQRRCRHRAPLRAGQRAPACASTRPCATAAPRSTTRRRSSGWWRSASTGAAATCGCPATSAGRTTGSRARAPTCRCRPTRWSCRRCPTARANFAQPWSYSNERDLFGTFRAEWDLHANVTAWAAYGLRRSEEANSLGNLDLTDPATGAATTSRASTTRAKTPSTPASSACAASCAPARSATSG